MAVKIPLEARCLAFRCTLRATHELFDYTNDSQGKFCDEHSDKVLRVLRQKELKLSERPGRAICEKFEERIFRTVGSTKGHALSRKNADGFAECKTCGWPLTAHSKYVAP